MKPTDISSTALNNNFLFFLSSHSERQMVSMMIRYYYMCFFHTGSRYHLRKTQQHSATETDEVGQHQDGFDNSKLSFTGILTR